MYFLAIVSDVNIQKGIILPAYTLCKSQGTATTRSGWRVVKAGSHVERMPKVLVATPYGHDEMIRFLENYRTRDHMHGLEQFSHESTLKYYPKGWLCWFECNIYGDITGPAILIEQVPVNNRTQAKSDQGFAELKKELERDKTMDSLTLDPAYIDL